ncbi:HAD family hydrolase [Rheinheimera sp. UJ63]|uniref:HAD family hydrolase n=1 Tax=Rheinheimera sp. UJ63 TaxID=2910157 RepID=UPI001F409BDB|nr:Cof-type HAD-IIB family hydrolase [Rheinheimera sp. UJ63]MCF4008762.1 Cof-type HAD-IIB family hydrolase [Rheinheimera sp. UJ63]
MYLICFDLDGTLLNNVSEISRFTYDTLQLLSEKDIAFTIATGRTMLSAQRAVAGHKFVLPQIYNNGVTIWDPNTQQLTLENILEQTEINTILELALRQGISPFVHVIAQHQHVVFHAETQHDVEKRLVEKYFSDTPQQLLPLHALAPEHQVTNISMIGEAATIHAMWLKLNTYPNLIAYSGPAIEGPQYRWMDVHHYQANKGKAVAQLKKQLGASKVICFGDGDNDLSMFACADESYAPANAIDEIKQVASAVIGHHHEDGVAHFLRERFSL